MPRSPEQFDDIRKQKKHLIMETALELFAENGYHATSISQIAAKAKISKGLTYNYFSSKREILDELMEHGFNEIYDNLDINHDGILSREEFIYFIRQNFKHLRDNMQHWKLFFSLLLQPQISQTFADTYAEKAAPIFNLFYGFIKDQGSTDPESDLMAISSLIEGAFLYCVAAPDVFPIDKLEEAVITAAFKIVNNQQLPK
ncbi:MULTISPECIES: TetR/AcrR family transcriptional regulator [Draconibacterium]|uniref:TetR/AcrR family transcriptional regulator n=1 Tax=Draconibacterium TaxID=1471399 RepID=UPI000695D4BF|nr:TetR/AcrR family transcriptional regulator [Draconibacterium sediminis]